MAWCLSKSYVIMTWCLVKHRNNFTFTLVGLLVRGIGSLQGLFLQRKTHTSMPREVFEATIIVFDRSKTYTP